LPHSDPKLTVAIIRFETYSFQSSWQFSLPLMMAAGWSEAAETKLPLKIMMKSAWGSDDPTKAAFPFLHGHALAEAGHSVQIFLLGEAVSLMRLSLAKAVVPVGWPPLEENAAKSCGEEDSAFCVWRVLSRPWSD
jgi:hypothetical protein